ncbi:PrgH/EprH family type III secretion apparatus protein [Pseudomonas sp. Irchel 3F5]|uniref:PrgH/EprH family type III secretion apparatus protein n=1 Tax=Pseudomonas sp. Irchel 3F5 TaxID=2009002 RepID=UPI000BA3DD94|nr:PrgH/EprH family type III secretion apparatus protein [Pseudomonas sp. Irchel 3F5]
MQTTATDPCVMRVFNGPMAGCEFVLAQGPTRVLVGPLQTQDPGTGPGIGEQVLCVPFEQDNCSFEVVAPDPDTHSVRLRPLQPASATWQHWPLQQQRQIGGLQLAFRLSSQEWALQQPVVASIARKKLSVSLRLASVVLALGLLVASVGVWSLPDRTVSAQQRSVSALVSAQAQVLQGRDQLVYVLVDSQREAAWNRQVLMRQQLGSVVVAVMAQEQQRLEQQLLAVEPGLPIRLLDLNDPQRPLLVLAGNTLEPGLKERLEQQLLRDAPYAGHLAFRVQDDRVSVEQALAGLRQIGVPFQRSDQAGGIALRIEGNLQDSQLEATRRFIRRFEQQWGSRFVHFSIVLQDDPLKGLSHQAGEQGYIKTSPASWQFQSSNHR